LDAGMDNTIKLVAVGAGVVGKSTFTVYCIQHFFVEEYDPTIEDVYRKQITVNNTEFVVDILDVAGEEEYAAVRDQYLRSSEGYLLLYSITDKNSFDEVPTFMDQILRVKDADFVPTVIIGNKCDLEADRQVETKAGENLAEKYKAAFFETSAKFGINVDEAVEVISKEIVKSKLLRKPINRSYKKAACVVC